MIESPYAGLYYCEKCHKTKPEKEFYGSNNLEKYPNRKLKQCKTCVTLHIDNWDPDTYVPWLEECDVPYVPSAWNDLLQKFAKDPSKLTGATIFGKYLAKMHLKKWKDYRYSDSEFLQQLEQARIEDTMKASGKYSASEIAIAVQDAQTIAAPPEPPAEPDPSIHPSLGIVSENAGYGGSLIMPPEEEEESELSAGLTDEDRKYLKLKWGPTYKPDEWVQLETLYTAMMNSYDIQTAGHIDTLKFICKTSLKANQLLDIGD